MKNIRVGAEIFLNTGRAMGPLGQLRGAFTSLVRMKGPVGAFFRSGAADLGKMTIAGYGTKQMLDELIERIVSTQELAASDVKLKIALMRVGEDPAVIEQQLTHLRQLAFETSKDVAGTKGDLEEAFAAGLRMGIPFDTIVGGLGRAAALLADATGADKPEAMRMIAKYAVPFNADPSEMTRYADLLAQGTMEGAFVTVEDFSHEMARAGPAVADLGGTAEEAAAWLDMISRIRTFGAGRSVDAALRELTDPGKQKKLSKYGLTDLIGAGGRIAPLPEFQQVMRDAVAGMNPAEISMMLNEVFGAFGKLAIQSLLKQDNAAEVLRKVAARPGVEAQREARVGTLEYQRMAVGGLWETLWQDAFIPAEKEAAKRLKGVGSALVDPIATAVDKSPALQKGISGGLAALIGAGGLATMFFGKRALGSLGKGMAGVGGWRNLFAMSPASLAKAKALEAVAGVQPVSVVNFAELATMPGMTGGGSMFAPGGNWKATMMQFGLFAGKFVLAAAPIVMALAVADKILRESKMAEEGRKQEDANKERLAKSVGSTNIMGMIAESRRARGEREGWSEEKIEQEILAAQRRLAITPSASTQWQGIGTEGADFWNKLLGLPREGIEQQRAAAGKQYEAAIRSETMARDFTEAVNKFKLAVATLLPGGRIPPGRGGSW